MLAKTALEQVKGIHILKVTHTPHTSKSRLTRTRIDVIQVRVSFPRSVAR